MSGVSSNNGGGGGGTPIYINPDPTTASVGGIPVGSTFPAPGKTMQQMFDLLLYPYIKPTFTSFLFTGISVLEVGSPINGVAQPITWGTSTPAHVLANSIKIDDVTGAVNLENGLPNTGSVNHNFSGSPIVKNVEGSNDFLITGTDTETPGVNFTLGLTIYWKWRVYAGTGGAGPLNQVQIKALSDYTSLSTGFTRTYSCSAGNYKYIAYPSSMGTATSFKDQATGFDVAMQPLYVVAVTNAQGITTNYNVHRTTNILGASINIVVS